MIADLFLGAAAQAAAWPPVSTEVADAGGHEDKAEDVFSDVLAATIDLAVAGNANGNMASSTVPSLADIWLGTGLSATVSLDSVGATHASPLPDHEACAPADEPSAAETPAEDASMMAWAIPFPVPMPIPVPSPVPPQTPVPVADEVESTAPSLERVVATNVSPIADAKYTSRQSDNTMAGEAPVKDASTTAWTVPTRMPAPNAETTPTPVTDDVSLAPSPLDGVEVTHASPLPAAQHQPASSDVAASEIESAGRDTVKPAIKQSAAPRAAMPTRDVLGEAPVLNPGVQLMESPEGVAAMTQAAALPADVTTPAAKSRSAEPGRAESAAQDPRVVFSAANGVAVDVSNEGGDSRNSDSRSGAGTAFKAFGFDASVPPDVKVQAYTAPHVTHAVVEPVTTTPSDPTARLATPVATQPPTTTAQDTENVTRLVESMRVQWRQGVPEATVRLKPEHLGEVTISIRVERGAVSAVVHAETPAVQQWLESQEDKLRSSLADQGLHLERFVVQRGRQQDRREQPRQQAAPRYRQPREEQPRFEVSV